MRADSFSPTPGDPAVETLPGAYGFALSVDLEEWYHTCLVPDYVDPGRRPASLKGELDSLVPQILELFEQARVRATFFILGEVARRLPARVKEIADAGHEIGSHSDVHLRVDELSPERFREDARVSKELLEDLSAAPVEGFRAPEWSMRYPGNPRLRLLAEVGYRYDSSLAPCLGAGRLTNPVLPCRLSWSEERRTQEIWAGGQGGARTELIELPPLTFAGPLRLPAGSWPGRLAGPTPVLAATRSLRRIGGMPVLVVQPWEICPATVPRPLSGLARFVQRTGTRGYPARFRALLEALPWEGIASGARTLTAPGMAAPGMAAPVLAAPGMAASGMARPSTTGLGAAAEGHG